MLLVASRLSEGNGAVSEAGKGVFHIGKCLHMGRCMYGFRNSNTDIPVTSRGHMTKHV